MQIRYFGVTVVAYILAHGLTAMLITPLQARLLPDVTSFASLLYLPHGVRVLATWLLGRVAILPLCVGAFLSEWMFAGAGIGSVTRPWAKPRADRCSCACRVHKSLPPLWGRVPHWPPRPPAQMRA